MKYSHDYENEHQDVAILIENQFGLPADVVGKPTDGTVEYVKFSEQATFKGYILNADDFTGLGESEAGVYNLLTGTDGTHCQDVLVSSTDSKDSLTGHEGKDLLFAYGNDDTLNGGTGNDLIVLDAESCRTAVVLTESGADNFDTVVNFNESSTVHLNGFVISFDDEHHDDNVIANIDESELSEFLKNADLPSSFYLITNDDVDAEGTILADEAVKDSDIWFITNGEVPVIAHVAHFDYFDFSHYKVTATTPVLPV